jgi:regulator of replication initiation timing
LLLPIAAGCSAPVETVAVKSVPAAQAAYQAPAPAPEVAQTPPMPIAPMPETTQLAAAVEQYSPDEMPAMANEAVEAVLDEITELRKEMASLRHELSGQIEDLVSELREENQALRQELTRLSALASSSKEAGSAVPVPDVKKREEPVAGEVEPAEEPVVPALPEPKGPSRPFVFTSVKEWGRSPQEAARMTPKAASLAGVVGTVPRGSGEKDLVALGLELHKKYEDHDNVHIEVFDDADAAKQYAERSVADDAHRVLSVSKHAASGRDAVLIYREGLPLDVTSGTPKPVDGKPE